MWDYVIRSRLSDLRNEADARRLAQSVQSGSRRSRHARPMFFTRLASWLQDQMQTTVRPQLSSQEMQSCVDA